MPEITESMKSSMGGKQKAPIESIRNMLPRPGDSVVLRMVPFYLRDKKGNIIKEDGAPVKALVKHVGKFWIPRENIPKKWREKIPGSKEDACIIDPRTTYDKRNAYTDATFENLKLVKGKIADMPKKKADVLEKAAKDLLPRREEWILAYKRSQLLKTKGADKPMIVSLTNGAWNELERIINEEMARQDPTDSREGYDIKITRTGEKLMTRYKVTAEKPGPLHSNPDIRKKLLASAKDKEFDPMVHLSDTSEMLTEIAADLCEAQGIAFGGDEDEGGGTAVMAKKKPKKKVEEEEDDDDLDDDEGDDDADESEDEDEGDEDEDSDDEDSDDDDSDDSDGDEDEESDDDEDSDDEGDEDEDSDDEDDEDDEPAPKKKPKKKVADDDDEDEEEDEDEDDSDDESDDEDGDDDSDDEDDEPAPKKKGKPPVKPAKKGKPSPGRVPPGKKKRK